MDSASSLPVLRMRLQRTPEPARVVVRLHRTTDPPRAHLCAMFPCEQKGGSLAGRRVKRFTNLATANYKEKRSESKIKMADLRNHSLALRAIHDADVRFGILPSQSRFREDDEVKG